MTKLRYLLVALLAFSIVVPAVSAQSEPQCNPIQETEICIQNVQLSNTTATPGDKIQIQVTVHNSGNETGDAVILLGVHQPEGGYTYMRAEVIHNLAAGQTKTIPIPFGIRKGEPVGVHELNFMVMDESQQHLYDASGYYHKVVVEENKSSFDPVGWFISLGSVAQAALAISAFVIFILTGKFVW